MLYSAYIVTNLVCSKITTTWLILWKLCLGYWQILIVKNTVWCSESPVLLISCLIIHHLIQDYFSWQSWCDLSLGKLLFNTQLNTKVVKQLANDQSDNVILNLNQVCPVQKQPQLTQNTSFLSIVAATSNISNTILMTLQSYQQRRNTKRLSVCRRK